MAGYSDGATANPGEGWLSTDGVNFGDVLTLAASEKEPISNASICLKAFTLDRVLNKETSGKKKRTRTSRLK